MNAISGDYKSFCIECGCPYPTGTDACPACGRVVYVAPPNTLTMRKCPLCGFGNLPDVSICEHCRDKLPIQSGPGGVAKGMVWLMAVPVIVLVAFTIALAQTG